MGAAISICGRKEDVEASSLVAIIPTDAVPDDDSDASSDTTSSWESDNEEAYEFAWETVDIIFELACSTLESQGWKQTAIGAAKRQADDAFNDFSREEREALKAEADARREREEYEEALRVLEKEREEMEAAEREAEREQQEADEAEQLALKEREEAEEAERMAVQEVLEAEEAEEAFDKEREEAEEAEKEAARLELAADIARQAAEEAELLSQRAILKDKALAEAARLRDEADFAQERAAAARATAQKERAEADAALAVAQKERAEAEAAILAAEKERLEAEEAERRAAKERREAREARREAERERREYEEALRAMEKERAEAEEAQRRAEKERAEAVEARSKYEERQALFHISECIAVSKTANHLVQRTIQLIPDDHATLQSALEMLLSAGDGSGRILVRAGRHHVSSEDEDGEVQVEGAVEIEGEDGAVLVGSIILGSGSSGRIHNIHVDNQYGTALWALGGSWKLDRCQALCGSSSKPAMLCAGDAVIHAQFCVFGGLGGKQESRTAVSAQTRARVELEECHLRSAAHSSLALHHSASLSLASSSLSKAPHALCAKDGTAASLTIQNSSIACDQVWEGSNRPGQVVDFGNRVLFYTSPAGGTL